MDASSLQTLFSSFHILGLEIGYGLGEPMPTIDGKRSNPEAQAKVAIEKILRFITSHQQEWLLVFDNYDPLERPQEERFNLRDYFPGGSLLPMDFMSVPEAVSLLEKTAGLPTNIARELKENIVSNLLSCLPLAVAQAGAYIRNSGVKKPVETRLKSYQERYREHEATMLKGENGGQVMEYGKSVMTTWDMSFQVILANNRIAAELLLLFGFYHYNQIPQEIFERSFEERENLKSAGIDIGTEPYRWLADVLSPNSNGDWDSKAFEDAMTLLEIYSLLSDTDGLHYNMHPLVHSWTRVCGNSQTNLEQRAHLALSLIGETFNPKRVRESIEQLRLSNKVHTHIKSCLGYLQRHTDLLDMHKSAILRPRTLLRIRYFLSGDSSSPQDKAQRLVSRVGLLAAVNGCRNAGYDDYSTLQALRFVFESMTNDITGTNDAYGELMRILLELLSVASSRDSKIEDLKFRLLFRTKLARSLLFSEKVEEGLETIRGNRLLIEERGHELSLIDNIEARCSCASVLSIPITPSKGEEEALEILNDCMSDAQDESVAGQPYFLIAQMSKISCLIHLRSYSEAEEFSASIAEACRNAKTSKNILMETYFVLTKSIYFHSQGVEKALEIEKLYEAWNRDTYGDFDMATMDSKRRCLTYEFNLLKNGALHNFPLLGQATELDQMIVAPLELTLMYKRLGREEDIRALWPGVIKQTSMNIPLKSIIRDYVFAFGIGADTAAAEGYASHAELLRKHAKDLESRTLDAEQKDTIVESMEPWPAQLERLETILGRLDGLEKEMKKQNPGRLRESISKQIISSIQRAPPRSRGPIIFFAINYLWWLIGCDLGSPNWIMDPQSMETLQKICFQCFGTSDFRTLQCAGLLMVTYHLQGETGRAIELEDDLLHRRKEDLRRAELRSTDSPRETAYASVVLETVLIIYSRRQWIDWRQQLLETLVATFVEDFGITHPTTTLYLTFLYDLYTVHGRLNRTEEIIAAIFSKAFRSAATLDLKFQIVTQVMGICDQAFKQVSVEILFVLYRWAWEHEQVLFTMGIVPVPNWKRETLSTLELFCKVTDKKDLEESFALQLAELSPEPEPELEPVSEAEEQTSLAEPGL
jgi:hypothetical protein